MNKNYKTPLTQEEIFTELSRLQKLNKLYKTQEQAQKEKAGANHLSWRSWIRKMQQAKKENVRTRVKSAIPPSHSPMSLSAPDKEMRIKRRRELKMENSQLTTQDFLGIMEERRKRGDSQFTTQDFLEIIIQKWWLIAIIFAIAMVITISIGLMLPKKYLSTTLIMVEKQQMPSEYIKATVGRDITERLETISQQVMSRSLLEKVITALNLYGPSQMPMDSKIERMRKNIVIEVKGQKANAFILSFKGDNPEMVMKTVDMLASLFIEENLRLSEQQLTMASAFLENELKLTERKLEEKEKAIEEYKSAYIGELPEQTQANLASLNRFQSELQKTTDALRSSGERIFLVQRQAEDRKKELQSQSKVNPLQNKLDALKAELINLQTRYTDKYPDIPGLKREIKETEELLKKEEASNKTEPMAMLKSDPIYQSIINQLKNIEFDTITLKEKQKRILEQIKIYQQRVENAPVREQQLIMLTRDYEDLRKNYNSLLNKKHEAQLSENLEKRQKGGRFRVLDPANLPQLPYWPKKNKVLLISFLCSVGISFGSVFLLEFRKPGFKKPGEAEDIIGLPVFATIPNFFMFNIKKDLKHFSKR